MRDYHNQCPSGGRGKARASYKLARLESIEAFSKKLLLFSDQASFLKNRDENADELWAAPWVLHDEASLKSALTSDAAAHGRFMMFSSQFESSAPAQKHGRAFLKIQDGTGTQVAQILTEMQGDSMALVGVLGGQQTVSVACWCWRAAWIC